MKTADSSAVLAALGRYHGKWDFVPSQSIPEHLKTSGSQVVRQLYWRAADTGCPWLTLAIDDLENAFSTGYALAKVLTDIPVLVVRSYVYGDLQLKVYLEKDCILKVGDDPDHELAWLPVPLEQDRVDKLREQLCAGPAFSTFLTDVLDGRVDYRGLERGLNLRSLAVGFSEIQQAGDSAWQYLAWVKSRSL